VSVDSDTNETQTSAGELVSNYEGVINGASEGSSYIEVHQGLDTADISTTFSLDPDLVENQYIIEIDNRLGMITHPAKTTTAPVSYIDDDNMASYYLTLDSNPSFVSMNTDTSVVTAQQVIQGARGTIIEFKIKSSVDLESSTYLFTKLGSTKTVESVSCRVIDTFVRVTGQRTGYRVDIPVRFVKKI
jgi:hypothetical protein